MRMEHPRPRDGWSWDTKGREGQPPYPLASMARSAMAAPGWWGACSESAKGARGWPTRAEGIVPHHADSREHPGPANVFLRDQGGRGSTPGYSHSVPPPCPPSPALRASRTPDGVGSLGSSWRPTPVGYAPGPHGRWGRVEGSAPLPTGQYGAKRHDGPRVVGRLGDHPGPESQRAGESEGRPRSPGRTGRRPGRGGGRGFWVPSCENRSVTFFDLTLARKWLVNAASGNGGVRPPNPPNTPPPSGATCTGGGGLSP